MNIYTSLHPVKNFANDFKGHLHQIWVLKVKILKKANKPFSQSFASSGKLISTSPFSDNNSRAFSGGIVLQIKSFYVHG